MSVNDLVLSSMNEMARTLGGRMKAPLDLPPRSLITLGLVYTKMEPGKMLAATLPFQEGFMNPLRIFQGGFLNAGIDDVFGPLAYMVAQRPVATIEMSTSFFRPFKKEDGYVEITAEVVSHTKNMLVLKAEVKNKEGKLVATASSHGMIVADAHLKLEE